MVNWVHWDICRQISWGSVNKNAELRNDMGSQSHWQVTASVLKRHLGKIGWKVSNCLDSRIFSDTLLLENLSSVSVHYQTFLFGHPTITTNMSESKMVEYRIMYISILVISVSQLDYRSSFQASLSCSSLLYNLYCQIFLTFPHIISLLKILYQRLLITAAQRAPHSVSHFSAYSSYRTRLLKYPSVHRTLVRAVPLFPPLQFNQIPLNISSRISHLWPFPFNKANSKPASSYASTRGWKSSVLVFLSLPYLLGETRWHGSSQWCCSLLLLALKMSTGTRNCSNHHEAHKQSEATCLVLQPGESTNYQVIDSIPYVTPGHNCPPLA